MTLKLSELSFLIFQLKIKFKNFHVDGKSLNVFIQKKNNVWRLWNLKFKKNIIKLYIFLKSDQRNLKKKHKFEIRKKRFFPWANILQDVPFKVIKTCVKGLTIDWNMSILASDSDDSDKNTTTLPIWTLCWQIKINKISYYGKYKQSITFLLFEGNNKKPKTLRYLNLTCFNGTPCILLDI